MRFIASPSFSFLFSACRRARVLAGLLALAAAAVVAVPGPPASAYPYASVTLEAHGFGGGRGWVSGGPSVTR